MKRRKCFVGGALLLFMAALATSAAGETAPLTLMNKSLSPEDRVLSFDLWNTSGKVITAWRLSLAYDDGSGKSRRSVLDQDFAFTAASRGDTAVASPAIGIEGPILQGEVVASQWAVELPEGRSEASALSLRVVAVVFEDGSFEGDPEVSRAILAARSARLVEIKRTVAFLRRARSVGRSRGSIEKSLADKAAALRLESQDSSLSDGLRREVAAQLSATRLEMAELLASLETSVAVDTGAGDSGAIDSAITGLQAQVAAAEGSGHAARLSEEVQ